MRDLIGLASLIAAALWIVWLLYMTVCAVLSDWKVARAIAARRDASKEAV